MAAGWDQGRRWIAEAGRPVADALLADLAAQPGQTILELAAGTGELGFATSAAVGETGTVIVTDFAPEMVAVAARLSRELGLRSVACRVMGAEDMDQPDASVDGVLCRWGYMLMPHPARALVETRRVLRAGGRLAFAVFAEPSRNPWASLVVRGPHLRTCAWWSRRSSSAVTAALSPSGRRTRPRCAPVSRAVAAARDGR